MTHDDKRLKNTLQKLNVRDIPAIEEVNLFKSDGYVIHFSNPKVQASIAANTYVVSGQADTKKLQDLLPGIINQLAPENLEELKNMYSNFDKMADGEDDSDDLDDDVPELVGVDNFEDASNTPVEVPAAKPQIPQATTDTAKGADDDDESSSDEEGDESDSDDEGDEEDSSDEEGDEGDESDSSDDESDNNDLPPLVDE